MNFRSSAPPAKSAAATSHAAGTGETVVNSIEQDGTHQRYDLAITEPVSGGLAAGRRRPADGRPQTRESPDMAGTVAMSVLVNQRT